jgi:NAD(P)H dehydrogenase (quinone)
MGFVTITEAQLRGGMAQMGLPADVVNAVASIQADFAAGAFDIVTGDVERLSGRAPRSLRDVLTDTLG